VNKISEHITYKEAIHSDTAISKGIDNTPNDEQLSNMKLLAEKVFEPLRKHFNIPIFISSFFRSPLLNKTIGGAKNSQHQALNGAAMDIDTEGYLGVSNEMVFNYITRTLTFDQCIQEDIKPDGSIGWVHISYNKGKNRNQILTMVIKDGKKQYEEYIT
jgi:zinc D-Ala-D-Ala carboxypeptidase